MSASDKSLKNRAVAWQVPGSQTRKKKQSKYWNEARFEKFLSSQLTISRIWSGLGGNLNNPASKYLDIWENPSLPAWWTSWSGVVWWGVLPRPVSHLILRRIIILMFPLAVCSVFRARVRLGCLVLAMCSLHVFASEMSLTRTGRKSTESSSGQKYSLNLSSFHQLSSSQSYNRAPPSCSWNSTPNSWKICARMMTMSQLVNFRVRF